LQLGDDANTVEKLSELDLYLINQYAGMITYSGELDALADWLIGLFWHAQSIGRTGAMPAHLNPVVWSISFGR
jgi:hypothetical protein